MLTANTPLPTPLSISLWNSAPTYRNASQGRWRGGKGTGCHSLIAKIAYDRHLSGCTLRIPNHETVEAHFTEFKQSNLANQSGIVEVQKTRPYSVQWSISPMILSFSTKWRYKEEYKIRKIHRCCLVRRARGCLCNTTAEFNTPVILYIYTI